MSDSSEASQKAPQDARTLAGWIVAAWYDDCFSRLWPLHVDGEDYEIADEDQYKALGEADEDGHVLSDAPLILVRKSDGVFFEVELDAHAWETSVAAREAQRAVLTKMRERAERQKQARETTTKES